jgi:hypothetical protein
LKGLWRGNNKCERTTVVVIALNMYETRENKTKKIALWHTNNCKYFFFKKSAIDNTLVWNLTFQTKPPI